MGISQEGLTRETLTKTSCLDPILTIHIPVICRAHALLRRMLTRELPAKTLQSSICLESSHSLSLPHTTLINKSHNKYRVQKIEYNYTQIWHKIKANKNIIVNYNFTKSYNFLKVQATSYSFVKMTGNMSLINILQLIVMR